MFATKVGHAIISIIVKSDRTIIISRFYSLTIVAVPLLRSDFSNPFSLLAGSGHLRKQTTIRHAAAWKGIDWFRTRGRWIRSSRLSFCAISRRESGFTKIRHHMDERETRCIIHLYFFGHIYRFFGQVQR